MVDRDKKTHITPENLIVITKAEDYPLLKTFDQPVHVGLKIEEILGKEAVKAFTTYRLYTNEYFWDPQKAGIAFKRFTKIAGFSPIDVLETVSQIELSYGFTTL